MGTVLVVGGESPVSQLVHLALRERGHKVVDAAGVDEGLAELGQQAFDLLVFDLTAFALDEGGVLQRLRAVQHRARTPIMLLSRDYDSRVASHVAVIEAELGVVDHLAEPLDLVAIGGAFDRVFGAVSEQLERRQGRQAYAAQVFRDVIELQHAAARRRG